MFSKNINKSAIRNRILTRASIRPNQNRPKISAPFETAGVARAQNVLFKNPFSCLAPYRLLPQLADRFPFRICRVAEANDRSAKNHWFARERVKQSAKG
jgi:hypothetical protein